VQDKVRVVSGNLLGFGSRKKGEGEGMTKSKPETTEQRKKRTYVIVPCEGCKRPERVYLDGDPMGKYSCPICGRKWE